jgi:acyl-[acyl-carrier-protein]-phospholipid O-acyltransferase/long-chain-fatty-acid--[acyl-carrier-protein] ligase
VTAHEDACDPTIPDLSPLPPGWLSLGHAFWETARRHAGSPALADSTGASLDYRDARRKAVALARVLDRLIGPAPHVGLLLPPTVPAAIANVALTLLGRVPVNLNYSASDEVVDAAIRQAGITHVVTSRKAMAKFGLKPSATLVNLEDVPPKVGLPDKLLAAASDVLPRAALAPLLPGLARSRLDEPATIIFTSGSTGEPKGVVLTHRNVLSNAMGIEQQVRLKRDDVVLGILPFFHSFGFTVTLWTVLALGKKGVYHFNPLDARTVGKLSEEHGATVMAATPTFMRTYLQRCGPEQFSRLRLLILGAEKLKPELAAEIERTIHVRPVEGYGCTETGPVVSVNVPGDVEVAGGGRVPGYRLGSVGRPLPGTKVRTLDPESARVLPRGREGLIAIQGPQVMTGYLGRPDLTEPVLRDGWYQTGDLGYVDADGFLHITDRISRFSKIGGEMVPHGKVESAIAEVVEAPIHLAVTALPDAKRGERLIVVHTGLPIEPREIARRLQDRGLPRLWIPSSEDYVQVAELPVLGTGKLDLRAVRKVAAEALEPTPASASSEPS